MNKQSTTSLAALHQDERHNAGRTASSAHVHQPLSHNHDQHQDPSVPHQPERIVKEKVLDVSLTEGAEQVPEDDEEQQYQRWRRPQKLVRYGFERLGHMYTMGVPFRFEELQGRHPFDFVDETKDIFRYDHKYYGGSVPIEDVTLLEPREWMEPVQRGQIRWDYCRDKWLDKASKIGAACAPLGCLYSLWEVTLTCRNNGGVSFLVVYFITTVLFALPFVYMELALGQFHRLGVVKTLGDVCPLLKGLAYLLLFSCTLEYIMLACRSSWLIYYLVACFRQILPWSVCGSWATPSCEVTQRFDEYGPPYTGDQRTPAVEYFRILVSRKSIAGFKWKYLFPNIGLLFSFFFLVFVLRQILKLKCRALGKVMLIVFTTGLTLCTFCFVARNYTSTVDYEEMYEAYFAHDNGMDFYYNENVWLAAIRHSIIGTGIGTGIHISFGSHNGFTNGDIKAQALMCAFGSYFLHIFMIGSFSINYFTVENTRRFKDSLRLNPDRPPYGTDIVMELFPQVAAQFPRPTESWVMITSMLLGLLCLAVLRNVCVLHTIRQHFCDKNKEYYEPYNCHYNVWEKQKGHRQKRYTLAKLAVRRKAYLMTKFMLIAGMFTIATFFYEGVVGLYLLENFWYKYMTVFIVLVEALAIFFFLGMRTLNDYLRKMTSSQVTLFFGFLWKSITPGFAFFYAAVFAPGYKIMNIESVSFEEELAFYIICLILVVIQLLHYAIHLCRSRGITCWDKLVFETTPANEHAGLLRGTKPASRLHWVHHLCVPKLMRCKDLNSKDNRWFFNAVMECLWFHLNFKWLNWIGGKCMVNYYQYLLDEVKCFSVFPEPPFKLRPEKDPERPEYIPNRQIKRIKKMKRKNFYEDRKEWLHEKVVVEKEGVVVEMEDGKIMEDAGAKQPVIRRKEVIEVSSSSSSLSLSDREESPQEEYGFALHETYEAELQISDGESIDEAESNDWDDLSGDETDEDALALLRLDSYDDISSKEPSVMASLYQGGDDDEDLDEEDRKELEHEEKDKVNAEFLFEDIDAEQEIWEDSDVVDDNESDDSETDVTDDDALSDESKRSHSPGSMSDNELLVDVIYTDSDVDTKKSKKNAKSGKSKRSDENADSWSDYSSSTSRSDASSVSSVSSVSVAAPIKRRRVSFGATSVKTFGAAVERAEDKKAHHHHRHHQRFHKPKDGQQPVKSTKKGEPSSQDNDDDDVLSGPYSKQKETLTKTLGRLKKKIMAKVRKAMGH